MKFSFLITQLRIIWSGLDDQILKNQSFKKIKDMGMIPKLRKK